MAERHGNVLVHRTSAPERWLVVQRDGTTVEVPGAGSGHACVADATRVIVMPLASGDFAVLDGTKATLPSVGTIPRPTGHAETQVYSGAGSAPTIDADGHLWVPMHTGGLPTAVMEWDGTSWTRHDGFGTTPNPNRVRHDGSGLLFSWGTGDNIYVPVKHWDGTTVTTAWDPPASITAWEPASNVTAGTVRAVELVGSTLLATLAARTGVGFTPSSTWSGIYRINPTTGDVIDLLQPAGYNTQQIWALAVDLEGDLWAIARHTATSVDHLLRLNPTTGTVIAQVPVAGTLGPYSLQRGPRLGPTRRPVRSVGIIMR